MIHMQNLFHKTLVRKFALDVRWGEPELKRALAGPLLERFIGVIYVRLALRHGDAQRHRSYCHGLGCLPS